MSVLAAFVTLQTPHQGADGLPDGLVAAVCSKARPPRLRNRRRGNAPANSEPTERTPVLHHHRLARPATLHTSSTKPKTVPRHSAVAWTVTGHVKSVHCTTRMMRCSAVRAAQRNRLPHRSCPGSVRRAHCTTICLPPVVVLVGGCDRSQWTPCQHKQVESHQGRTVQPQRVVLHPTHRTVKGLAVLSQRSRKLRRAGERL